MLYVYFLDDSADELLMELPTGVIIKLIDRNYLAELDFEDLISEYNCTINYIEIEIPNEESDIGPYSYQFKN